MHTGDPEAYRRAGQEASEPTSTPSGRSTEEPERAEGPAGTERETAAEGPGARPARVFQGTGVYVSAVVGFLVALALVVFVAQNTESVTIDWLVWSLGVPVGALVLGAVVVGGLLTVVVGLVWRRRRRRILTEREELRHLRSRGTGHGSPDA